MISAIDLIVECNDCGKAMALHIDLVERIVDKIEIDMAIKGMGWSCCEMDMHFCPEHGRDD